MGCILIDMTGQSFGLWQVIRKDSTNTKPGAYWWCICTGCNREISVDGGSLRDGKSKGCIRCRQHRPYQDKPKVDLTGQRFGSLVAMHPSHLNRRWYWLCHCDCGNKEYVACGQELQIDILPHLKEGDSC